MKSKFLYVLSTLLLFSFPTFAQQANILSKYQTYKSDEYQKTLIQIAQSFIGRPYVAATLEGKTERLVCNLEKLDCFTFVDQVVALSLAVQKNKKYDAEFLDFLQKNRYRNGEINGYGSRIHYFTDWAKQAEKNGFLIDISKKVGVKFEKTINFMSTHTSSYEALKSDPKEIEVIKLAEENLNKNTFFYIKKTEITKVLDSIKTGDIIAFTSSIPGLDVNHEGFAYWDKKVLRLLHASLEEKKVVISAEPLAEYLNRIKKHTGIMIYRPTAIK